MEMREEQMKEGRVGFVYREKEDRREEGGKRYVHTYIHTRGSRRLKIGGGGRGTLAVYEESRGEKRIRRDRDEVRYSMCREKEGRREMGGNRVHTYVNVRRKGRN